MAVNLKIDSGLRALDRVCDAFESLWLQGARPLLDEYLSQVVEEDREKAFAELLALELAYRRQARQSPSIEEYRDRFPGYASVIAREFAAQPNDHQRAFGESAIDDLPAGMYDNTTTHWPTIPGLNIVRELGRGGMGIVYLAEQTGLRRLVAVKMLRAGAAAEQHERARFRTEMEAAASLKHPNIVQIFQVGNHDGQPFCVLEYVPGGSLRDYLRGQPQPPRVAANFISSLATALQHAHEHGIVHRDLKPANILLDCLAPVADMVDTFVDPLTVPEREELPREEQRASAPSDAAINGHATTPRDDGYAVAALSRPKIADFGLARRIEADETGHTLTGAILGTPGYLAPEQAAGRSKETGPASDIYALGVILYEMLTGQPPHAGATPLETLQLIRTREAASPRALLPSIPRDLETICLKCLSIEPTRRYESASALADDLNRFVRHEPIQARPAGRVERLWRWCRREKKVALLELTVVALLLLGVAVAVGMWRNHQRQLTDRFVADLRDVENELKLIDREEFTLVPQMDNVRRLFLEQLAAKCRGLLDQGWNVSALRRQMARVHDQLGTIHGLLGAYPEAASALIMAIKLQSEMASSSECGPGDCQGLARSRIQLASLYQTVGRFADAEVLCQKAIDDLKRASDEVDVRLEMADALQTSGGLQLVLGQLEKGERSLRGALEIQQELAQANSNPEARLGLAVTESTLAQYLTSLSKLPEAFQLLENAIEQQQQLADGDAAPIYRLGLSQSLAIRARALEMSNRIEESAADLLRAYETVWALAREYPNRPDYQIEAGIALQNVARHNQQLADETEAVTTFPAGHSMAEPATFERRLREAMAMQERMLAEFPEVVENHRRLAATMNELATWLCDKSTYEVRKEDSTAALAESDAIHRRSLDIWMQLVTNYPGIPRYQMDLARCHQRYSIVLTMLGRLDEAETMLRDSIARQSQLAEAYPEVIAHHIFLVALNANLGTIYDQRGDPESAEVYFRKSLEHGERAFAVNAMFPTIRLLLVSTNDSMADILLRADRYQEAVPYLDDVNRLWRYVDWWSYKPNLARCQELSKATKHDQRLSEDVRMQLLTSYENRTLELLRFIVSDLTEETQQRNNLLHWLQTDIVFDHIRHRQEFQELQRSLGQKQGKGRGNDRSESPVAVYRD